MNGFRPGMADAAVISNNGIRHVRASDITRYGKMRFCFWNGPGRFRHFLTIQGDRLEIHIKRRGVNHDQLVTFATSFKLIGHVFWSAFYRRRAIQQFNTGINRNLQRIHAFHLL